MAQQYRQYAVSLALVLSLAAGSVAKWEGKSNRAYMDMVQVPTICYGNTQQVRLGDVKTDSECTAMLHAEVAHLDDVLTSATRTPLLPYQRAAFISWMYNVGTGNFYKSTVLKKINRGDVIGACKELPKWSYSGGVRIRGLYLRRLDEQALCLGEKQ